MDALIDKQTNKQTNNKYHLPHFVYRYQLLLRSRAARFLISHF